MKNRNTFRGCMLGGAAGDALGYAVEFISAKEIFNKYGENGITEFDPDPVRKVALISDDTQMSLFTAGGLLTGKAMGAVLGYSTHIYRAYLDWYRAQYGEGLEADETVFGSTWLFRVPALNYMRAPGNTCMSALGSGEKGSVDDPINNSCGCGGVMRVAPIGLFFAPGEELSAEEIDQLGAEAAALTHGHELGWLPAALMVRIMNTITYSDQFTVPSKRESGDDIPAEEKKESLKKIIDYSIGEIRKEYADYQRTNEFCNLIEQARDLAFETDTTDKKALFILGEGWKGDEALAVAVYCALRYAGDFEKCLIAAVNHNGDSDSTGALAGSILGAFLGASAIPEKFLKDLEIANVITDIADDLYTQYQEVGDDLWTAKYVMNNYKI